VSLNNVHMESSILRQIRKKVQGVIDQQLLKKGTVLDVRNWPGSPMIEIDLHLPGAEMEQWSNVPYIKFSTGEICFRDYTPFGWDAEISTCSLLIDTAHDGPGSKWAKKLRTGDIIQYLKIDNTRQLPHSTNLVVGLGDNTSLAHLLALHQLTMPATRFDGAVLTDSEQTGHLLKTYFSMPVSSHMSESELVNWLGCQGYCAQHTSFYLTGNKDMVILLRKVLKSLGHENIRVKSFWS
jgi:NADPH-dependent ferric siderophore reductase